MRESRQEEIRVREDPSGCQSWGPMGKGHELSPGVVPKQIAITRKTSLAGEEAWHKLNSSSFPTFPYPRVTMEKSSTFQPFRR